MVYVDKDVVYLEKRQDEVLASFGKALRGTELTVGDGWGRDTFDIRKRGFFGFLISRIGLIFGHIGHYDTNIDNNSVDVSLFKHRWADIIEEVCKKVEKDCKIGVRLIFKERGPLLGTGED